MEKKSLFLIFSLIFFSYFQKKKKEKEKSSNKHKGFFLFSITLSASGVRAKGTASFEESFEKKIFIKAPTLVATKLSE